MKKMSDEKAYLEKLVEIYEEKVERNNELLKSIDLEREKIVERSKSLNGKLAHYKNMLKKLV